MTVSRRIATLTTITALAAAGVATAADAPVISQQSDVAGAAPFTIPGTGIHEGEWMGSRSILAVKTVTLERGQRARVTLRATGKRRVVALATPEGQKVAVTAVDSDYAGDRSVTARVSVPKTAGDGKHVGLVSALTR